MKIYTLLALGGSLMASSVADAAVPSIFKPLRHAERTEAAVARSSRPVTAGTLWRPLTQKTYGWTGWKWELDDTYALTYDRRGNAVEERIKDYDGVVTVITKTFNDNNKVLTSESVIASNGVDFKPNRRELFEYDPRMTDVITAHSEWIFLSSWQQVGNNYKRKITRNELGYVTSVEISTLFEGAYDPIIRIELTYGADNKPTVIKETSLAYNGLSYYWVDDFSYTNLEWASFDGQIANADDLFSGANRISRGVLNNNESQLQLTVTYMDNGRYEVEMTGFDGDEPVSGRIEFVPAENDGYTRTTWTTYTDNGVTVTETETETMTYDSWGILTGARTEWTDGETTEIDQNLVGTVEYDPTHGYPLSYTVTEDYYNASTDSYITTNTFRVVYADYADVASVNAVVADESDAPVEYFNLQGLRIARPEAGTVCIRRQGSKVSKIVVR